MIRVIPIPPATASATTQQVLVEIDKCLCKKVCVNGVTPKGDVEFVAGDVSVLNGIAIVPITATGSIIVTDCNGCKQVQCSFTEHFDVAFAATEANSITLVEGDSDAVSCIDVRCCHSNKVRLSSSLTVSIA